MYTEGGSKVGILTRRLLKIFRLERVTIAYGQGTSEDKNFDAKQGAVKNQFLNHVRYVHKQLLKLFVYAHFK